MEVGKVKEKRGGESEGEERKGKKERLNPNSTKVANTFEKTTIYKCRRQF